MSQTNNKKEIISAPLWAATKQEAYRRWPFGRFSRSRGKYYYRGEVSEDKKEMIMKRREAEMKGETVYCSSREEFRSRFPDNTIIAKHKIDPDGVRRVRFYPGPVYQFIKDIMDLEAKIAEE